MSVIPPGHESNPIRGSLFARIHASRGAVLWRILFWSYLIAWTLLLVIPIPESAPVDGSKEIPFLDKIIHFVGYFLVAALGRLSGRSFDGWMILVFGILHGIVLEFGQSFLEYRTGDPGDAVADVLGVWVGWWLLRRPVDRSSAA